MREEIEYYKLLQHYKLVVWVMRTYMRSVMRANEKQENNMQ